MGGEPVHMAKRIELCRMPYRNFPALPSEVTMQYPVCLPWISHCMTLVEGGKVLTPVARMWQVFAV